MAMTITDQIAWAKNHSRKIRIGRKLKTLRKICKPADRNNAIRFLYAGWQRAWNRARDIETAFNNRFDGRTLHGSRNAIADRWGGG